MGYAQHRLSEEAFERLREQVATAAALCGDDQLLELADALHASLRRRKDARHGDIVIEARSFHPG